MALGQCRPRADGAGSTSQPALIQPAATSSQRSMKLQFVTAAIHELIKVIAAQRHQRTFDACI